MNDLLVSIFLKNSTKSLNDLSLKEFFNYKSKFYSKYKEKLNIFTSFEKQDFSSRNFLYRKFFKINDVYRGSMNFTHTRIKTGKRLIMVPVELDIEMEMIFSKDLNESGLFRKSASVREVNDCRKLLFEGIESGLHKTDIINTIKKYDIITHTIVFKSLFDYYDVVFPARFLSQLLKISKIKDGGEKLILAKFCVLAIPHSNRFMLDSICRFFSCIHFIVTDKGTDYSENMNIGGFAAVMGPKLFVKNNNIENFSDLSSLISLLDFIFRNYEEIFKVEDI